MRFPWDDPFDMSDYTLKQYPQYFYRVMYSGSQAAYSRDSGFTASGPEPTRKQFENALSHHFDWHSKVTSPFISVTSDREDAYKFAKSWCEQKAIPSCDIMTINMAKLDGQDQVMIFNARTPSFYDFVPIRHYRLVNNHEHPFFRRIPPRLIVKSEKVEFSGMKSK